jgi:hypothetical protein
MSFSEADAWCHVTMRVDTRALTSHTRWEVDTIDGVLALRADTGPTQAHIRALQEWLASMPTDGFKVEVELS